MVMESYAGIAVHYDAGGRRRQDFGAVQSKKVLNGFISA